MAFQVRNDSAFPVVCEATIAHWFSASLLRLSASERGAVELLFDEPSGTLALAGQAGEPMALETIWCGIEGRAYATRALLPFDRSAIGTDPAARDFTCDGTRERLDCR